MALFALISWLLHPYKGNRAQVAVDRLRPWEPLFLCPLTAAVTALFYFILTHFQTANLFLSTLSVTTSFAAVYLTFRRSPLYALAYAVNDVVLILLWSLASLHSSRYFSVVICFCAFLANDLYGFFCWRAMEKRQAAGH
jgi:nicotinamide riboside transporter PnuC